MSAREFHKFDWERAVIAGTLAEEAGSMAVSVGLALAVFANADGTSVFPSQETLARGFGKDRSTVSRALAALRNADYVEQVEPPTGVRSARYRLTFPDRLSVEPVKGDDEDKRPPAPELSADEAARVEAFDAAHDDLYADEPAARHLAAVPPAPGKDEDDPWAAAALDGTEHGGGPAPAPVEPAHEPLDLSDVPPFDADDLDDEEPRPEPERLGHFGAKTKARREREAAKAAREPGEYRPRYGGG